MAQSGRADQRAAGVEHSKQVVFVQIGLAGLPARRLQVRDVVTRIDLPQLGGKKSFASAANNKKLHIARCRGDFLRSVRTNLDQLFEVVLVVDPDVTTPGVVAADDLEIDRMLAACLWS